MDLKTSGLDGAPSSSVIYRTRCLSMSCDWCQLMKIKYTNNMYLRFSLRVLKLFKSNNHQHATYCVVMMGCSTFWRVCSEHFQCPFFHESICSIVDILLSSIKHSETDVITNLLYDCLYVCTCRCC